MSDPLESELDTLFQQPPAAHVEARTALSARLRKAGDKAGAERVKSLKRPTPAAWALNQVHFQQPALLEEARAQAVRLRELHARDGIDAPLLTAAIAAQRAAANAVVDAAMRCAAAATVPANAALERKLSASLQAWLSGTTDEAPGRMTHDQEATGFAAITSVGRAPAREVEQAAPTAGAVAAQRSAGSPPSAAQERLAFVAQEPAAPGPDPLQLARARALMEERERTARTARELLEQRSSERTADQRALEEAQAQLREAERRVAELRDQVLRLNRQLEHSTAAGEEAARAHVRAQAELERARAALAELDLARGAARTR